MLFRSKAHSRPEGDEFKICDALGNILLTSDTATSGDPKDPKDVRPEIDRSVLRKIIVDACPADSIKWGRALVSATSNGDGTHALTFSDGSTVVCDILVGADGSNSRVRPLVSLARSEYSGVNGAEISLTPEVVAHPDMEELRACVGHGTAFATSSGRSLGMQLNGDGRVRVYAWLRGPEEWVLPKDPTAGRAVLREIYAGWASWMLKVANSCDEEAMYARPLYHLPLDHRWAHVRGVTILGDAVHLMSLFAGEGANLAMVERLSLEWCWRAQLRGGRARRSARRLLRLGRTGG